MSVGCFGRRQQKEEASPRGRRPKRMKIEGLVAFSLVLLLRYAVPRAGADCAVAEPPDRDELLPPPRPDCAQGVPDEATGRCACDFGWAGRRCDRCTERPCLRKARVLGVRPADGPVDELRALTFEGVGFPRPANDRYTCLFDGTRTNGTWRSPTAVECAPPPRPPAAVRVALVPDGLQREIRADGEVSGEREGAADRSEFSVFLDFYARCEPAVCAGTCFAGVCVCGGEQCAVEAADDAECGPPETRELQAAEGRPFAHAVGERAVLRSASRPDVHFDALQRQVRWERPVGAATVELDVRTAAACRRTLRLAIRAPPAYAPALTNVTRHAQTNVHLVRGFLRFNGSAAAADRELPVALRVDAAGRTLERVDLRSSRRFFAHALPAYLGEGRQFQVFAEHPGAPSDSTPGLPFEQCALDAVFEREVAVGGGPVALEYAARATGCACGRWGVQVVWPRGAVRVHSQSIAGAADRPTLSLTLSVEPGARPDRLFVAISCDVAAVFTASHTPTYATPAPAVVRPARLLIALGDEKTAEFVEVTLEVPHGPPPAFRPLADARSPFFLVAAPVGRRKSAERSEFSFLFGVRPLEPGVRRLSGVLAYPNEREPLFAVPFELRADERPDFRLLLRIHSSAANRNAPADVWLTTADRSANFSRAVRLDGGESAAAVAFRLPVAGVYELAVLSDGFLPFVQVLEVTLQNSSFDVVLEPRPLQSVVVDERDVRLEVDEVGGGDRAEETHPPARPLLLIEPPVLRLLDAPQWITLTYAGGPPDSLAMLRPADEAADFRLVDLPVHTALCAGCAVRTRVRVERSAKASGPAEGVHLLRVPFVYTLPGRLEDFREHTHVLVDTRPNRTGLEDLRVPPEMLVRRTELAADCRANLLARCRPLFRRAAACAAGWTALLDGRVPSMRSLMRVLLYRRNCTRAGVRQEELAASLRCIISANIGACELQRPLNRKMLDCSLKSPSLIDESNLFNRLAASLHVGRFEVCRFLNGFFLHLHYLEALVPAAPLVEDAAQFGRFLAAVVAESDRGAFVTLTESLGLEPAPANLRLLAAWNGEFEAAEGNRTRRSALLPAFLRTTAELSALSTRMTNETPPALLDALVGRVLREAADAAPPLLRARVRVEPRCLREGGRLRVVLELENPTTDVPLDGLELRLGFTALNSTLVAWRVGPPLQGGRPAGEAARRLAPGQRTAVAWTAIPRFDFRPTRPLVQRAIVGVGFRLADGRRWHEVQSAAFRVAPAVRLRTFALLHANVSTAGLPADEPFNALLLVMNVGYAPARDVRLVGLRPEVVDALDGRPLPFALEAAAVDGEPRPAAHQLELGDLQSGESRRVALNLTTSAPSAGILRDLSVVCTADGRLPDGHSLRRFAVQRRLRTGDLVVAELPAGFPPFLLQSGRPNLLPLQPLFGAPHSAVREHSACLRSAIVAFRPAEPQLEVRGAVVGVAEWPAGVERRAHELAAVFQVLPNFDVLQRRVPAEHVWAEAELAFVDTRPLVAGRPLFYELVFRSLRPECAEEPLAFLQAAYRVPRRPSGRPGAAIVAQIHALHSPQVGDVAYELWSREPQLPFAVVSEGGFLVHLPSVGGEPDRPHCALLRAVTAAGLQANATVALGGRALAVDCAAERAAPLERLHRHTVGPHDLPLDFAAAQREFLAAGGQSVEAADRSVEGADEKEDGGQTTEGASSEVEGGEERDRAVDGKETQDDEEEVQLLPTEKTAEDSTLPPASLPEEELSTSSPLSSLPTEAPDASDTPDAPDSPEETSPIGLATPHEPPASRPPTTTERTVAPDGQLASLPPLSASTLQTVTPDSQVEAAAVGPQQQQPEEEPTLSSTAHTPTPTPLPARPPATSPLPVATDIPLNASVSRSPTVARHSEVVEMACEMRHSKPMLSVLCDLSSLVRRTH